MKSVVAALCLVLLWCGSGSAQRCDSLRLNIPAMRLDVYRGNALMASYPVAIGQRKYPTPTGYFQIREVVWHPWWIPPKSEWAKHEKPTPPGPTNPLGVVKMPFAPLYALHGTADPASIGKAASHGCVRLRNDDAFALGEALVGTVPLRVVYELVEVNDTLLYVHPDIYRRRTLPYRVLVTKALMAAGGDSAAIDMAAVWKVKATTRTSLFPLRTLQR